MPDTQPVFILVNPQMGENIGAAARAMLNFGLTALRIVNPRDGWPNQAAIDNATGAFDDMDEVRVFSSLSEAIADLNYLFAVTARARDIAKPVFTPAGAAEEFRKHIKSGFVFGPERTGLENDDVALCHGVLTIPTNPSFPVLNLAQSVSLMAYEFFKLSDATSPRTEPLDVAKAEKFDSMFLRLQAELEEQEFFKTDALKPTMLRNIRAMLMRGAWSDQEIRTFQGIISALKKPH